MTENSTVRVRQTVNQVIIIGAGCAGLSAAIYCARAGLSVLLFAGNLNDKGGLLVKTSIVENYPGFPGGIMGYDLVQGMERQAINEGAQILDLDISEVDFSKTSSQYFKVWDQSRVQYLSESVIIATGSKPNKLMLENEDKLWGHGVSSCAVCDGALYRNKRIVVVGGGDSAMEEAQFLTKFSDVLLIHRGDSFRASKAMQDKILDNPKIRIMYNTQIIGLHGSPSSNGSSESLTSITLRTTCRDKDKVTQSESQIDVNGLFYGLGLKPNSGIFADQVTMDQMGYIVKFPDSMNEMETMTSCPGVFVAGDVSDRIYRQAIVAAGDGCRAALDVNKYLN
jgi:thioredoxin reductase (NADPH)